MKFKIKILNVNICSLRGGGYTQLSAKFFHFSFRSFFVDNLRPIQVRSWLGFMFCRNLFEVRRMNIISKFRIILKVRLDLSRTLRVTSLRTTPKIKIEQ